MNDNELKLDGEDNTDKFVTVKIRIEPCHKYAISENVNCANENETDRFWDG